MTPDSRHPELLTQADARQLLERAGEIDYESTSVESLRAAAIEAGISPAAFEAALTEMRAKAPAASTPRGRWTAKRLLLAMAAAGVVLFAATMLVIPNRGSIVESTNSGLFVRCLPMGTATEIGRSTLGPNAQITMTPGSRVLRFRGSPDDLERLRAALAAAEKTATSCDNSLPGR
jgi:hypothetical protein